MHKLISYLRNGLNLASNDVESNKRANNRSYCDLLSMRTNTINRIIINQSKIIYLPCINVNINNVKTVIKTPFETQ